MGFRLPGTSEDFDSQNVKFPSNLHKLSWECGQENLFLGDGIKSSSCFQDSLSIDAVAGDVRVAAAVQIVATDAGAVNRDMIFGDGDRWTI